VTLGNFSFGLFLQCRENLTRGIIDANLSANLKLLSKNTLGCEIVAWAKCFMKKIQRLKFLLEYPFQIREGATVLLSRVQCSGT
jgi:hypothetical protein